MKIVMERFMRYDELRKLRKKLSKLPCHEETNSIINTIDKIDLSGDEQNEVLLFIKNRIPQILTANDDKLNILNNLLWEFLLIDKNASAELKLTIEKNNGSRFRQVTIDRNLCCIESFEKRIKENGKFENLEEYADEMYKKYGVDVIEYCEYDSLVQMIKEKDMKYIEKCQEENPGDYLKKMECIEEGNFNSFFKRKLIYKNYTDRPLLAMLSQRSLYIELNPLELPDNINKLIDALLKDELVKNRIASMCDLTKHYKENALNEIYKEELIDLSRDKFMSHFKDIQKILERRTVVLEIFQCLLCYLLMHQYGITTYIKAVHAMDYLMMKLYIEDATFFGAEDATFFDDDEEDIRINDDEKFSLKNLNKVLIHSESRIAARRKLAKTIKTTLNLDKM